MKITIRTLNSESVELDPDPRTTMAGLGELVEAALKIPRSEQRFIFAGSQLEEVATEAWRSRKSSGAAMIGLGLDEVPDGTPLTLEHHGLQKGAVLNVVRKAGTSRALAKQGSVGLDETRAHPPAGPPTGPPVVGGPHPQNPQNPNSNPDSNPPASGPPLRGGLASEGQEADAAAPAAQIPESEAGPPLSFPTLEALPDPELLAVLRQLLKRRPAVALDLLAELSSSAELTAAAAAAAASAEAEAEAAVAAPPATPAPAAAAAAAAAAASAAAPAAGNAGSSAAAAAHPAARSNEYLEGSGPATYIGSGHEVPAHPYYQNNSSHQHQHHQQYHQQQQHYHHYQQQQQQHHHPGSALGGGYSKPGAGSASGSGGSSAATGAAPGGHWYGGMVGAAADMVQSWMQGGGGGGGVGPAEQGGCGGGPSGGRPGQAAGAWYEGQAVKVWSNSAQAWFPGEVVRVAEASMDLIPSGSVEVTFELGRKWVAPSDLSRFLLPM